jgi:hypothetical protein
MRTDVVPGALPAICFITSIIIIWYELNKRTTKKAFIAADQIANKEVSIE